MMDQKIDLEDLYFSKIKWILTFLFGAFFILVSHFITSAITIGDFDYDLDTSSHVATVTKYNGSATDISIPEHFEYEGQNYDVKKISQTAFWQNASIVSVQGDSITKIEDMTTSGSDGAFRDCTSLETIYFENLIYLGTHAFDHCKSLQDINLPNVTYIGKYAFNKCNSNSLSGDISFPNAVYVGDNAFFDSSVQTLRLPKVTYIHWKAFHNCKKLTNLYAPNLVYFSMGNNDIFDGVTSDVEFYVSEIVNKFNYPSKPNNIFQNVNFDNLSSDITVKNVNTFEQIDSKIEEIKAELSNKYNIAENNIKFDVLGNCLVKLQWRQFEYNYAYAVKFYPNDYDVGISNGFTDIVYLISVDKFIVKFEDLDFTYTGLPQMPTVTIQNGESALADTDYDISCSDPVNAGNKLLNIILKGNYQKVGNTTDRGNSYPFEINKADIPNFDINVNESNSFTGSPIQLISSISDNSIFTGDTGANLWLRIADDLDELPTNDKPWVKFANESTLNDDRLKRTNVGVYYIYYYVDGGNNYNDVSTYSSSSTSEIIKP